MQRIPHDTAIERGNEFAPPRDVRGTVKFGGVDVNPDEFLHALRQSQPPPDEGILHTIKKVAPAGLAGAALGAGAVALAGSIMATGGLAAIPALMWIIGAGVGAGAGLGAGFGALAGEKRAAKVVLQANLEQEMQRLHREGVERARQTKPSVEAKPTAIEFRIATDKRDPKLAIRYFERDGEVPNYNDLVEAYRRGGSQFLERVLASATREQCQAIAAQRENWLYEATSFFNYVIERGNVNVAKILIEKGVPVDLGTLNFLGRKEDGYQPDSPAHAGILAIRKLIEAQVPYPPGYPSRKQS
jgi:hypothetical protein